VLVNYKEFEVPEKVDLGDGHVLDTLEVAPTNKVQSGHELLYEKSCTKSCLYHNSVTCSNLYSACEGCCFKTKFYQVWACWVKDSDRQTQQNGYM